MSNKNTSGIRYERLLLSMDQTERPYSCDRKMVNLIEHSSSLNARLSRGVGGAARSAVQPKKSESCPIF